MSDFHTILDQPYVVSKQKLRAFQTDGFIKLTNVFPPDLLDFYGPIITDAVLAENLQPLPMAERDTYQKAFLQVTNLWQRYADVQRFVFGKRLAHIATQLMGTTGVRLYHDQALYKEPSGGITPWHADQYYWPLASAKTCTAWIPLQETPLAMGPLAFSAKSHQFSFGRTLPISDESEAQLQDALARENFTHVQEAFALGEVSFHAGWTFHHAGANTTDQPRRVMTIIYMDEAMRLKAPDNPHQQADWDAWCPGATVGEIINTPLNPVLYPEA